MSSDSHMQEAIRLAGDGMRTGRGGPFGCVIVHRDRVIGCGQNRVTSTNDPTAHAEIEAIREACRELNTFRLDDCELYTSCEPCPMCLAAIYWARIPTVHYACTRSDAAAIGFDDDQIYRELALPVDERFVRMTPLLRDAALPLFKEWTAMPDKTAY